MTGPGLRCGALLLLLGTAPNAACDEGEGTPGAALPFEARLELQRADGRPGERFAAHEEVVLVLRLYNGADALRSLPLPSAQTHDFSISGPDGRELWRWSKGRLFAQMLGELALAPGEERLFRAAWEPAGAEGGPAAAGDYRAVAWVGGPGTGLRAASAEFRID